MSIQDLIDFFNNYQYYVLGYFIVILFFSLMANIIVSSKNINTLKYIMSILIYSVTIPGMLALFLLLYNILFLKTNILKVSIISYFAPIIAMIITIVILNQKVKMNRLPGFNKLSSLFVMISIAFGIIFVLQRSYFGVLILGSFTHLIIVFAVLMIILRFSWNRFSN